MKHVMAWLLLAALAACGIDGAPIRPTEQTAPPGVSVEGDATVGLRLDQPG